MALEHDDYQLLKINSKAVKVMSEGELLQMEKTRKLNIDEPVYLEIIRQKTASLFAAWAAFSNFPSSLEAAPTCSY